MIDVKDIPILNNCLCTLKETSLDTENGCYMTDSTLEVCYFDEVVKKYAKSLTVNTPKSCDAFYIHDNNVIYIIEFKNGKIDKIDQPEKSKEMSKIREKIFASLLILTDITQTNISCTRQSLNYILVYNETKNPSRISIGKSVSKKGNENFIRFGLARFKGLYFKNVFTVSPKEFEDDFVKKWAASR